MIAARPGSVTASAASAGCEPAQLPLMLLRKCFSCLRTRRGNTFTWQVTASRFFRRFS